MQLRSKSRVHKGKAKSLPFSFILHGRCHQVEKPTVQLPASPFTDMFLFGLGLEMQVLKDQNGVHRNPLTEMSSGFLTERSVAIVVFPGQPFQHSTDTSRVLVLCLLPGEFGLKSGANLASLGVANGQSLPADKERLLVGGGNKSVVHPQVDTDRNDFFRRGDFEGDTKESFAPSNPKTVEGLGGIEVLAEVLGNLPANLLPALQSGDGQAAVPAELEVLGIEKECRWSAEDKGTNGWSAISLGRCIGGSGCPNRIAAHLRGQSGLDFVVDRVVQFESAKRFAAIETDRTDGLLVTIELQYGGIDKGVLVKDYRYGSLNVHTDSIVIHSEKVNSVLKRNLQLRKEGGASSAS